MQFGVGNTVSHLLTQDIFWPFAFVLQKQCRPGVNCGPRADILWLAGQYESLM